MKNKNSKMALSLNALPLNFSKCSQKLKNIETKLKKKISLEDREKLKKQKLKLEIQLNSYFEYETKLMNGNKPSDFFTKEIEKPLEKFIDKWCKALKANPFDTGLYQQLKEINETFFHFLGGNNHILEKKWALDEMIKNTPSPSGELIEVNDEYSHMSERKKFAQSQLEIAISFFKNSYRKWPYELDMIAMYLSDGFCHYRLGAELLLGSTKEIDKASSMDTACREYIESDTWEFLQNEVFSVYGNYKQNKELIKARQEKKLLESLPQATHKSPINRI